MQREEKPINLKVLFMLKSYRKSPFRIPITRMGYEVCYSKKAKEMGKKKGILISFDYAIKFLLKNKEDFYVVENFLSSILNLIGYPEIKIIGLHDPEHHKNLAETKITIPDLLVKDAKGKRYLIEIERDHFSDAAYKAHYNTSYSTVNDFLDKGEDFSKIKKIIHISILYEAYGKVNDYIYHGRLEPKGMNKAEKLTIQKNKDGKKYNTIKDLPEYFFIFPENFDKNFKSKFDEWMNLLKTGEIREEAKKMFKDLDKVEERLKYLNLTKEEKIEFDKFRAEEAKKKTQLEDAKEKGRKEGKEEGRKEGKEEGRKEGEKKKAIGIAQTMLKENLPVKQISKFTGLSEYAIKTLIN